MHFHRLSLRTRAVLTIIGLVLVFASTYPIARDALNQEAILSYRSLFVFAGLLPLLLGIAGHLPELPAFSASTPVTAPVVIAILQLMACLVPPVVCVVSFENWIEDQGYRESEESQRHRRKRFTPTVFERVVPEPPRPELPAESPERPDAASAPGEALP